MSYRFLENTATADAAIECKGSLEEVFASAGLAIQKLTVDNLEGVEEKVTKEIELSADSLEQLFLDFLEELIYLKDTEHLIFREIETTIEEKDEHMQLHAICKGDKIDPEKHQLGTDVKAATYHQFQLKQDKEGWSAHFIVDI